VTTVSGADRTTVSIITLGCGRNEVDSDQLAGLFDASGVDVVDDPEDADVVLVNTCTFIAPAKQESIDTVLAACDLKERGARAVLVVGCMAERYPHELADAIPEADAVIGFAAYPRLPDLVGDILAGRPHERVIGATPKQAADAPRMSLPVMAAPVAARADAQAAAAPWLAAVPERPADDRPAPTAQDDLDRVPDTGPRFPVRRFDGRPWAYLKIASGCDRACTFCAIPSFRGRFRSRTLDEILAEASWLSQQGARELVLVSENTTSWGKDLDGWAGSPGGRGLQPRLLEELSQVDGVDRLRLMYLQPAELQPALLEAIAELPKVASYFDLSLQHVAAPVLQRMARSGSPERFGALLDRIRSLDPNAAFRSNFILGFPGETDDDVRALEDFLQEQRLDWVGLFTFSEEDGTPSATMPDQVDPDEALARLRRVADVQERIADDLARGYVGRELDVLVDEVVVDDGRVVATAGRSYREAPDTDGEVRLVDGGGAAVEVPVGRMVRAKVVEAEGVDLVAEVALP
jgi:ribosomal protein S12 methylthiotransferase RimO